jgi:hypothetical protein
MATPTFILPSAPTYTEGFVNGLNVYPNPTNFVANQVPFTRATTATRTNAAGLIELVPYNLFQYSEQFDNATWNKTNASITANTTISPSGIQNADTMTDNATVGIHGIDYAGAVGVYTCSVYAKKSTSNYIGVYSSSALQGVIFNLNTGTFSANIIAAPTSYSITSVGNGWYRCTITTTTTSTAVFRILMSNDGSGFNYSGTGQTVFIWGAQLVEGTDALPYQLTETRLNRPRVDFSLGGCPSLLLEPQRTNLFTFSEQFDDALWLKLRASVTSNTTASPSGVSNADTISVTSSGQAYFGQVVTTIAGTVNVSIYCKYINQQFLQIYSSSAATAYANFDIQNGVVGSSGVLASNILITSAANGFYRISVAFAVPAASINIRFAFIASSSSAYNPIEGVAGRQFYAWGAQFETGAFQTTYIPTTSASVTRNTDTFTLSNIYANDMIGPLGGTFIVDLRNNKSLARDAYSALGVGDSTTLLTNALVIIPTIGASRYRVGKYIAGVYSQLYITTSDTAKIAIKWNGATADVFENGVKVVSATAFTTTIMQNLSGTFGVPTYLSSMALYNTAISDAECIQITTL